MAKYSNTIAYQIQTKLDATGLNQLQKQLSSVSKAFTELGKTDGAYGQDKMKQDISRIQQVQNALSKSFNTNLNLIDLSAFKKELGGLSFGDLQQTMSKIPEGAKAFNSMLGTVGQIDTGFKSISSLSDKIVNTFGNTVRWGVTASIFQTIQNSLYRSVDYIKELDTSLNNIQIVTGETSSNLTEWAKSANEAAAQLGASTTAFTDAAQLYAQNGYSQEDYTKLAELTTKVANVTQQSTSEVSEEITSLMAGYKMSISEAEDALSGMATVAAASASDLGELATAEQKVASAASTLGVSQDELTAQLSTIISVTREAPEQVGNSLKTIYARLGDLSLGETLEDGVSLGDVSSTLEKVGVTVLDVSGNMRSMGDILEDLMAKWDGLSQAEQQALAVKLAGKYQYNNLMTLMNNSDMYYEQKNMAGSSQGALDEQQAIYMESMEAKLQKLQTQWEGVIQSVTNADSFKPFIDAASNGLDIISDIADTIGGMGPALTLLGSLMTKAFSQNIAAGVTNMLTNQKRSNLLAQNEDAIISTMGGSNLDGTAATFLKNTVGNRSTLTGEQAADYNDKLQRYVEVDNQLIDAEAKVNTALAENQKVLDKYGIIINDVTGKISGYGALELESSEKSNLAINNILTKLEEMDGALIDVIQDADNAAGDISQNIQLSTKDIETFENAFNDLRTEGDDSFSVLSEDSNKLADGIRKMFDKLKSGKGTLEDLKELREDIANVSASEGKRKNDVTAQKDAVSKVQKAIEEARAARLASENAEENALADAQSVAYQQLTQQIMTVVSSIGQMAFAWQSFQNLGSIWADNDISAGEKIYKTFLAIVTTVPQIVSGAQSISSAFKGIEGALGTLKDTDAAMMSLAQDKNNESSAEQINKTATDGNSEAKRENQEAVKGAGDAAEEEKKKKEEAALAEKVESDATKDNTEKKKGNILATGAQGAAAGALTVAEGAETVATNLLTVAVKSLSAAFKANPVGLFITALGAGISIISAFAGASEETAEKAKEEIKDLSDASAEEVDSIKTAREEFNELYKKYKAGDVSSDELKTKADEINGIVDDQTQKLVAANDEWDEYYKNLNGGSNSSIGSTLLSDAKNNEKQLEQAAKDYVSAPGISGYSPHTYNGSSTEEINRIAGADYSTANSVKNISKAYADSGAFNFTLDGFVKGTSAETRAKAIEEVSKAYEDELNSLSRSMGKLKEGTDEYAAAQKEYKALSDSQERFKNQFVNPYSEELQAYEDAKSKTATGYLEALKNDDSVQYSPDDAKSVEENLQAYNEQIKKVLTDNGLDVAEEDAQAIVDAFVQGMAEANPNSRLAKDTGAATAQDVLDAKTGYAQEAYTVEKNSGKSEEEANAAADEFYATLGKFTDDEIIELKASVDYETLRDNADAVIERLNNGEDLTDIIADITAEVDEDNIASKEKKTTEEISNYSDNGDYTTSKFTSDSGRASKFDTTAEEVKEYTEALQGSGGALEDLTNKTKKVNSELEDSQKKLKGQIRELEASGDESDEAADKLKYYKGQLSKVESQEKSNTKQLERMTNKAIESSEAIEYLTDNFDDNKDILSDTKSSYKEITDATNDLIPGVEGLLNIDMSGWSQDMKNAFMVDPTNLANLEAAINGDEEALQRLRSAAAEQILVSCGVDPNTNNDLYTQMLSFINLAQDELPKIEAGASIDDTTFTDQLEKMIQNAYDAGMTVDQIMNFLSGLGIDAEIETVSEPYEGTAELAEAVASGDEMSITTAAQRYSGSIEVPKVQLKKDENGNALVKKSISGSAAGARPGRTGSGGSSSGGSRSPSSGGSGGGSGNDDYSDDQTELTENELDRYEKVNAHLDDIANSLDKVADEQDRVTGQKYIENISQQIALLKKEVEWEEEKLEIEKQEAAEYKNLLGSEYGVQFNSEGFVENYADVYNQLLGVVNEYERQYNATTSQSAKESIKEQIDAAKERLEKFEDYIGKYDELFTSTISESEKKIQEYRNKIEDLQIEAFNKSLENLDDFINTLDERAEFHLNFSALYSGDKWATTDDLDRQLEYLGEKWDSLYFADVKGMKDYYKKMAEQEAEAADEAESKELKAWHESNASMYEQRLADAESGDVSNLGTSALAIASDQLETLKEQWEQYEDTGTSSIFGENSAALLEALSEANSKVAELTEEQEKLKEDALDKLIDAIDNLNDKIDEWTDRYDSLYDYTENLIDLQKSFYGEDNGSQFVSLLEQQGNIALGKINAIKKSIEKIKEQQKATVEGEKDWVALEEQKNDLIEQQIEAYSNYKDIQDQILEANSKTILNEWLEGVLGTSDLEWLGDEWELIERNAEQYLDDVNAAYNVQKLQSKYLDLLDNSNQLSVQNQITDQMNQQLNYLREKDKLSQYDVDYANAQFEILQKTIALQEAQANKSQMKLKRDNQGNYSYVYTANESDISSAQGDLLDAENNAYNLTKDNIIQNQNNFYSAIQSAYDLLLNTMTNNVISYDDKVKRIKTITDSLKEYVAGCGEQISESQKHIINDIISMAEQFTEQNQDIMSDVTNALDESNQKAFDLIDKRLTKYAQANEELLDKFSENFEKVFGGGEKEGAVETAMKSYETTVKNVKDKVEQDFGDIKTATDEVKTSTDNLIDSTDKYLSTLTAASGTVTKYQTLIQGMNDQTADSTNKANAFKQSYDKISSELSQEKQKNSNLASQLQSATEENDRLKDEKATKASSSSSGNDGWSPYDDAYGIWVNGDWGGGDYWYGPYSRANGTWKADQVLALFNSGYGYTWMDTGGYTGDWGPGEGISDAKNGKMAILHSKELVLNASDTENILSAVQAVRQLTTNFRNGAFEDTVEAFSKYGSDLLQSTLGATNTVDQQVHIEATFPNVKGAEEIEQALLSLTNGAVQYAGRSGQ